MMWQSLFPARLMASTIMTDVMIDIETTGTDPANTAMIQLACVPFNFETEEIGTPFNRCLEMPLNRYWSESTKTWWGNQPEVLAKIQSRAEDPSVVLNTFFDYIRAFDVKPRFWSRGAFDWAFIESHLKQFNLPMPFNFWEARDLRSFLSGLNRMATEPDLSHIQAEGAAHDALFDCVIQLKRLFAAKRGDFNIEVVEGEVIEG